MRLTEQQITNLILSLTPFLVERAKNEHVELRLYGSRINDQLKGGDIDLLLLVENPNLITQLQEKKHHVLAAIKKRIGDQKIDLLIADKNTMHADPFLKMIEPTSLLLKTWCG